METDVPRTPVRFTTLWQEVMNRSLMPLRFSNPDWYRAYLSASVVADTGGCLGPAESLVHQRSVLEHLWVGAGRPTYYVRPDRPIITRDVDPGPVSAAAQLPFAVRHVGADSSELPDLGIRDGEPLRAVGSLAMVGSPAVLRAGIAGLYAYGPPGAADWTDTATAAITGGKSVVAFGYVKFAGEGETGANLCANTGRVSERSMNGRFTDVIAELVGRSGISDLTVQIAAVVLLPVAVGMLHAQHPERFRQVGKKRWVLEQ